MSSRRPELPVAQWIHPSSSLYSPPVRLEQQGNRGQCLRRASENLPPGANWILTCVSSQSPVLSPRDDQAMGGGEASEAGGSIGWLPRQELPLTPHLPTPLPPTMFPFPFPSLPDKFSVFGVDNVGLWSGHHIWTSRILLVHFPHPLTDSTHQMCVRKMPAY